MATNVEYKALSQCASDVVALLHHTNLSVASKLLARGLITDDVYTWVLSAHGVSDLEKANRLFSCVSTRVKSSPRCFHDFVDVLSEEPYFTDVVNELNTVYESMSQSSESMQPSGGLAASGSTVTTTQLSPRMYEKPELKDAFRTLLSLAAEWKTIGTLLGLQNHVLDRIKADEDGGIVRTLRQSDAQLFAGWGSHAGVGDAAMLEKMDRLASKAAALLKENVSGANNMFVFTGCGTSGRIAWACSRSFNNLLNRFDMKPCFHYLIAGGDQALIVGKELPEDDPPQGAKDLQEITRNADHVILFGITCGLSAPYVAGQIDFAMKQANFTTVLVGFNPVELSRSAPIEKWHKTCKDTFVELQRLELESNRGLILNPIVGPEPITGSSRMKGGSMTAILLDIIFITALSRAFNISVVDSLTSLASQGEQENSSKQKPSSTVSADGGMTFPAAENGSCESQERAAASLSLGQLQVASVLDAFAATYLAAYRPVEGVASLLEMAAESLRHPDGHIYYLGTDLFGVLGFIDSSEMVSTFGSSPHEVRGFIAGGWIACQNREGDLSHLGQLYSISLEDFEKDILPNLHEHDCVIWFDFNTSDVAAAQLQTTVEKVLSSSASCGAIVLSQSRVNTKQCRSSDTRYKAVLHTVLPHFNVLDKEPLFTGFALKLILNAISTGANTLKGKVFRNTMINLTVANDKLFYRSVGIIRDLSGVDEESARDALLRSIYRDDDITKYSSQPVSAHITAATKQSMVVPFASVLAGKKCSVAEATSIISRANSLRALVQPTE